MAVPSNPKLTDVYNEFGAPANTPLSAFVRGGSWVPNTPANNNVPTSPPISLSQLAGAVKTVSLTVSASSTSLRSSGSSKGTFTIGSVTLTPSGGTPPYTYNAATKTADGSDPQVSIFCTQSGAQYTFSVSTQSAGIYTGDTTWSLSVTDSAGATASVSVHVGWN